MGEKNIYIYKYMKQNTKFEEKKKYFDHLDFTI